MREFLRQEEESLCVGAEVILALARFRLCNEVHDCGSDCTRERWHSTWRDGSGPTFCVVGLDVLEDLDVARDLLAGADPARLPADVITDELVATAGLVVDDNLLSAELRDKTDGCAAGRSEEIVSAHPSMGDLRFDLGHSHSKKAISTSSGQTSSPFLPAGRFSFSFWCASAAAAVGEEKMRPGAVRDLLSAGAAALSAELAAEAGLSMLRPGMHPARGA